MSNKGGGAHLNNVNNKKKVYVHASGWSFDKTKNTFIFTTIITGYIICAFLCVGSWGHSEVENKGKKENSKTAGSQKLKKEKEKNVTQEVKICYILLWKTKRCKLHKNIKRQEE